MKKCKDMKLKSWRGLGHGLGVSCSEGGSAQPIMISYHPIDSQSWFARNFSSNLEVLRNSWRMLRRRTLFNWGEEGTPKWQDSRWTASGFLPKSERFEKWNENCLDSKYHLSCRWSCPWRMWLKADQNSMIRGPVWVVRGWNHLLN